MNITDGGGLSNNNHLGAADQESEEMVCDNSTSLPAAVNEHSTRPSQVIAFTPISSSSSTSSSTSVEDSKPTTAADGLCFV